MDCPRCDFENLEESTFCTKCGFSFQERNPQGSGQRPYVTSESRFFASLLSLFFPGSGQVYNCQFLKAAGFFASVIFLAGLSVFFFGAWFDMIFITGFMAVETYMLADAWITACRRAKLDVDSVFQKKVYNIIGIALTVIFFCGAFVFYSAFSTLRLTAPVEAWDLKQRDCLFLKKGYYLTNEPQAGDLVRGVFSLPRGHYGYSRDALARIIEVDAGTVKVEVVLYWLRRGPGEDNRQELTVALEQVKQMEKAVYIYAPLERRKSL